MPNLNQALGAAPFGEPIRVHSYTSGGVVYTCDFVVFDTTGRVAAAAASAALCGAAVTSASAAGQPILVADHPDQVFTIQANGTGIAAQSDFFMNYNIIAGAGSTTFLNSGHMLDVSTGSSSSATLPLKAIGLDPRVDNALGQYDKVLVIINNHVFKGGTGTSGI